MFTYQNAFVKEKTSRGRWHSQDVSTQSLMSLYFDYAEVVLVVTNPYYDGQKAVWLSDLPDRYNARISKLTPSQFFESIGDGSLPVTDKFPPDQLVYAKFQDAFLSGYNVDPVNRTYNKAMGLPKSELNDLKLTRDNVDYDRLYKTCLATVNGFFHRLNYTTESVNILDGGTSGFYANKNKVGLFYLGDLGDVTVVPIQDKQVFGNPQGDPLKKELFVEIDERAGDLTNKSVLLVIGGYLHLPDGDLIRRTDDRVYSVDFTRYPWPQRFYDMWDNLDLSDLTQNFDRSTVNDRQVSIKDLYSDDTIRRLLTMSQSFFVIVDTPELIADRDLIESNDLPGSYVTHQQPIYPLILGPGRFHEYWFRWEYDRWVLNIEDWQHPNYIFETTGWAEENSIDDGRTPYQVIDYTQAFFWKLGKYVEQGD